MPKIRVHALAKELKIASADVLFCANELGIEVKTASSGLTEDEVELIKLELEVKEEIGKETEVLTSPVIIENNDEEEEVKINAKAEESTENIEIIEIDEKSTPLDIAKLLEKDSTKVVEDLLNMGILA